MTKYFYRKSRVAIVVPFISAHRCENTCFVNCSGKKTGECFPVNLFNNSYKRILPIELLSATIELPKEITLQVSYPLISPAEKIIRVDSDLTVEKILDCFREFYAEIYQREESTTSNEFFYECKECSDFGPTLYDLKPDTSGDCIVCMTTGGEDGDAADCFIKLKSCGHIGHEQCIHKWFKVKNQCPYCRAAIQPCICDGKREIVTIEPPQRYSDDNRFRETTNGLYGIYSYFFEDLEFTSLVYNIREGVLKLVPTGKIRL